MKTNTGIIILVTFLQIATASGNIMVENVDTIWNISAIAASQDVIDPGEAQPQNVTTIFLKDVDTIWNLSVIPSSQDVIDPSEAQPQNVSTIFLKDVDTIWNTSVIPASQDVIDPSEAQPQNVSTIFLKDVDTIWNISVIPASHDVIDPSEAQPQNVTTIFLKDVDAIWKQNLIESTDIIPPTTEMVMNETSSSTKNLYETVISQNLTLNTSVTGDLNGTLNFTGLENVLINSGSFAGKGFSRGGWYATIEGASYDGNWQGVLFKKPEERRIYIKGTIAGGLKGIVEGYLTESVNGSGVYDQYYASWTISQMGIYTVYSKIDVRGTINYGTGNEYSSELYALQTFIEGKASGYYNRSLSVVLTHVRVDNKTNPFYGQGFSIISYVSEYGSGEGWTYDKVSTPGTVWLKGLFTEPLMGIASGVLVEEGSSRTLSISIERIDVGSPPMAYPEVKLWGPVSASPGQRISYIIEYKNSGLKAAQNQTIIIMPSFLTDFISGSTGIVYIDTIHVVRYNITKVAPHSTNYLSIQVETLWGLQGGFSAFAYILPQVDADSIIEQNSLGKPELVQNFNTVSKSLSQTSSLAIPRWIRDIAEAIRIAITYILPPPCSEGVHVIEVISKEPFILNLVEAQTNLKNAYIREDEDQIRYWQEIVALLQNPSNYLGKYPPGTTINDVIKQLQQQNNYKPLPSPNTCIRIARDPNIKYGPDGFILPDQRLNYTVEFENEGEGIAFGVYFTDTLDEDVNDSTLEIGPVLSKKNGSIIAPPGTYNPATRTITWFVGEVGSKEGGYTNYSINARNDAEEGTEIINFAIVYFPSVPETTRTNGVVSIIDITPPKHSYVGQNESIVIAGETAEVHAYWQDGVRLNYTWLETNKSGAWQNESYHEHWENKAWSNFTIQTSQTGTICWRIHANDTAGNYNVTQPLCFDVLPSLQPSDTKPPTTGITLNGTLGSNDWYVSDVQVNLTATDNEEGSGVNKTEYNFDGTNWSTYTAQFNISNEGTTTIYYRSIDNAGNVESTKNQTIKIDETSPTIDILGVTNGSCYNNDVTPAIVFADTNLNNQSIMLNGVPFTSGTMVSVEGSYTLAAAATDLAENSASSTVNFTIDKTSPSINISGVSEGNYYRINVTPIVTINDANLETQSITLNGAPFTSGTMVSVEGSYTLAAAATDLAGNSASRTVNFTIGKALPKKINSEAVIRFDIASKDIKVYNNESGSEVNYVILPSKKERNDKKEQDEDDEKGWETRKYSLKDLSDNSLLLVLKHKKEGKEIKVEVVSMQYNSEPIIKAANNNMKAQYSEEKNGTLKELEQKIEVKKFLEAETKYSAKKNQTEIKVKLEGQKEKKETKAGIVILELFTEKGSLKHRY